MSSESANGYTATNSVSVTKIATELKNLPFSVDVIPEAFFKDFGLTEVYDIAALSAGVSTSQRQGGIRESYTVRGFTTF